jgi:hypothetical protein
VTRVVQSLGDALADGGRRHVGSLRLRGFLR